MLDKTSQVQWQDLEDGDYVVSVSGYASKAVGEQQRRYLAHTLTFITRSGKVLSFQGKRRQKRGERFAELKAAPGFEICRPIMSKGTVIGALQRPLSEKLVRAVVKEGPLGLTCSRFPRTDKIEVAPDGWAIRKGLRFGDHLVWVNGRKPQEMKTQEELQAALAVRPLRIALIQQVSSRKVATEEGLRAVKLVEGSANLETCLEAMQGHGSTAPAPPPSSTCQQQAVKWNRRFTCTRPNAAPLLKAPFPQHHQPAAAPHPPASQMPRRPAPAFDPTAKGGPSQWNLADTASISSSDRVLAWGWPARQRLPQPPCQGSTVDDVALFLDSFLKTRPGPDGKTLQSRLGEPATVLHFVTRVAVQSDGISCFLSQLLPRLATMTAGSGSPGSHFKRTSCERVTGNGAGTAARWRLGQVFLNCSWLKLEVDCDHCRVGTDWFSIGPGSLLHHVPRPAVPKPGRVPRRPGCRGLDTNSTSNFRSRV